MQIFRPFYSHEMSAKYLDDKRLNKQILESYQINNFCFRALGLLDDGRKPSNYMTHPVVRILYNDGKPYLPDHWNYMWICDKEWQRRGRKRNPEFMEKMLVQKETIANNPDLFTWGPMIEYFRFGDKEIYGREIYPYFQALLSAKWKYDKLPNKCSIKIG